MLEYNPQPPFQTGSPEMAGDRLIQQVKLAGEDLIYLSQVAARNSLEA